MIIYASDGTERCEVQKFTYHGTFMGECFLNMDVTSPSPIPFEIGDYCDFRGERFYLNYIPAKEKTASLNSRGDAFRYSSMKMNSAADELTRCKFKDIVPSSYNVVWTGLPNFTFYAQTAQNLADRIQANLDAMYTGDKKWTVNVITANLVDYNKVKGNIPIDAEMSFNDKSCMEALAEFYNTFKVVYIIRGRTITVAPDGTSVGATFGYGPDAGLYDLQQQTKQDSLIVTRLYVYGSTRNIGTHYYANLTGKAVATVHDSTSKYCVVQYTFTGGQSFTESSDNFATYEFLLNGTDFHKYSSDGSMTASDIAAWVATQPFSGWTVTANGDIVTFTATESGDKTGNFGFQVSYTGTGTYTLPKATHVVTMASSSDISEYASATFTILGPSDAGVNYHIVLGGDTFNIETTNSLSTAAAVADFIASHTFTGWTVSHATGETSITFTAQNAGLKYPFNFYSLYLVGDTSKHATASIVVSSYGLKKYDTVTKGSYTYFYVYLNFEYSNSYYKNKVSIHDENEYKVTLKTGNISVTGYMFVDLSAKVLARVYSDDPNYNSFKAAITDSSTIYITDGVYLDLLSSEYVNYDETISGNLAVNNLMLPDFPLVHNNPNDVYIDDAAGIAKYGIREASVTFDGSDSAHPEVCPTIKEMTAKEVEDAGISLSLDPSEGTDLSAIRLDEVKACDMPTDSTNDGNLPTATDNNYNSWQKTFVIYIKDLGFDLTFMSGDNYYYATSDKMQISMISGPCTGRTFDITKIEKDTSLGYLRYKLTCDRYQDTNINKVYPYDDYPITGGNQFVLLNIRLPKVYVDANAQKLLVYGNAYLSKNNSTKYTYIPKVSEIWMAKHADIANNIKEGDLFDFSDTDFNISDSIFIKTLSITVGDKAIPSYDITLDDETESSTIQKMQNQIDDVVVSGGVTDSSVVNALIANYAKTNLVSKVNNDEVGGNITFDKNVTIKGILTLGNDIAIKNLSATTLTVDNDAGIGGGLTVGGSTSLKDVTATTGDFSGLLKAAACTVAGLITTGSVLATNLTNSKIPYQTSAGLADSSLVTDGTNLSTAGTITSPTFIGELNGNAASASVLTTTTAGSNINPVYFANGIPVASTYSFGNGSEQIPINNGTLNSNLNADMVDGFNISPVTRGIGGSFLYKYRGNISVPSGVSYVKLANISQPTHYNVYIDTDNNPNSFEFYINGFSYSLLRTITVYNVSGYSIGTKIKKISYYNSSNGTIDVYLTLDIVNATTLEVMSDNELSLSDTTTAPSLTSSFTLSDGCSYQSNYKIKVSPRTIWGQSFDGSGNVNGDINIGNANIIGYNGALVLQNLNGNLGINPTNNVGIGTTTPQYKLDVNGTLHAAGAATLSSTLTAAGLITANGGTHTTALTATALSTLANTDILGDAQLSERVMSPDYVSQTTGWGITRAGAADFRNIYADELRVQAFTADISQALAGSDYLTKSVSKLSANFVVPSVNSTVRIIVDDIEGMPATQCFANGDYIRFRAFNRTSGLTIANVWGTVALDTTYGTNGFLNGTQAYTFTCKATSGAGLTVFKGSEVLDYGTSGSGMIARTTLDAMGSPYEQIATWVTDPSVSTNYTVHARLGNLGGIANCNGYGLYTDNGFFTGKIIIGDLTKTANYLSFDTVNGLQIKLGGTSVATTSNVSDAQTAAQNYATINCVKTDASNAPTTILNSHVSIGSDGTLNNAGGGKVTIGGLGYSGDLNATNGAPSGTYVGSTLAQTIESKANNAVDNGTYTTYINAESGRIDARISQQLVSGGSIYTAASLTLDGNGISLFGKSVDISSATVFNSVVKATDYNGNTIASLINQTDTTVAIQASHINLVGAITLEAIDKSSVTPAALGAATPTDVSTAVNGIQIGGTNLIVGSSTATVNSNWSENGWSNNFSTYSDRIYKIIATNGWQTSKYKFDSSYSGKTLTISFYAKIISSETTSTTNSEIMYSNQTGTNPYQTGYFDMIGNTGTNNMPVRDTWIYCKKTIVLNSDCQLGIYVGCGPEGSGLKTTVLIKDLKVEEGNKATSWSPAPEDVDASISTAQSAAIDTAAQNAANLYVTSALHQQDLQALQSQIDGAIETWFYEYVPTSDNAPANTWTTDAVRNTHLGDLFYNTLTGYCYRYQLSNSVYSWAVITDTDVTTALANAAKAQDTADHKRRVFITTPTVPYDAGDMWAQGSNGDILVCETAKAVGQSYSASDWVSASKYTDDTVANIAKDNAATAQTAANNAQTSANTANSAISDMTSDDKITAQEKQAMKTEWDSIVSEKTKNDTQADNFGVSRTTYDSAYSTLSTTIGTNLSSLTTTWDLGSGGGATLRSQFKDYYDARTDLLNAISTKAKALADAAKTQADTATTNAAAAQETANTAATNATTALNHISDLVSDNILSAAEKKSQLTEWKQAVSDKASYDSQAEIYNITTERTDYDNAFIALANYLNGGTTWTSGTTPLWFQDLSTNTTIVGDTYRNTWLEYYKQRGLLLNKITAQAKSIAESNAASDATTKANDAYNNAVSQAGTNAAALYVTQTAYSSQVTVLQDSINAKVSQTDFNALGTRVGTAESNITQNANAITTKVSSTDYNGNTIASLINQTATTVAIQASKINLVGAVTISAIDKSSVTPSALGAATPTDVTTAVNGIQVGGRNLLQGTKDFKHGNNGGTLTANDYLGFTSSSHSYPTSGDFDYIQWGGIAPTPNTYYTLSFYAKSTNAGDNILSYFYPNTQDGATDGRTGSTLTDTWKRYIVVWHTNDSVSGVKNVIVCRLSAGNGTGTVSVCGVKFEEGNKATDWSPAPEDVDASIATAQSTADAALTRNNTMAVKLGYTDYTALASAAALGHTLIDGGMINTVLINATAVVTNGLTANCITANMISAGSVTADKLATNVLSVGNISGLGSLATQNSLAYDGSYITNKPTSLSAINTTEGTKLGGIAAGATVGATWGTNVAGIPTNLSSLTGTEGIKNTLITISANGTLSGAGGGQVTVSGIGACTPTQAQGYATTSQTSAQDNLATKLGYTNYSDLVTKAASTDFGTLVVGGYLNTALIQAQAISTNMLAAGSVTADKIAANTITATQIAAGTITTTQLNATDIISNLIEANNISTGKLTVTGGSHLGALTVGSDGSLTCGSNYSMSSSGTLTVNNATIHGNITANTFATANNTFTADANGNITCNNGTFNNAVINGGIRSPFTFLSNSFNLDYTDNVSMYNESNEEESIFTLPWDLGQSGRHISVTNYLSNVNGTESTSQGLIYIIAPSGKYFYENGQAKTSLTMSREIIEMVGYGSPSNFYGWIITNRRDLVSSHSFGKNLKCMGMGNVTFIRSSWSASIDAIDFAGNTNFTVSRIDDSTYRVQCPVGAIIAGDYNNYIVMCQGTGYCDGAGPCKATLTDKGQLDGCFYFTVVTSDDSTKNDGNFEFMIFNKRDFMTGLAN